MTATLSAKKLKEVALTGDEYKVIVDLLGRAPNEVELGMIGVLWSEHCSYKTSKPFLRRLPSSGARVIQGPGENAGVIDVGEGWAVVFKIESHNHPSAIEPYEGAATGVGGILRDVAAMGARPVAILDSLRFGPLPASRHLFEGVVSGIGGYGNCVGVPTVGGEVYFEDCYADNPLVNAMCVGIVRIDQLQHARAEGPGNLLLLVGADTGRDGIHGASFASLELDDSSEERRPAVQVGNPFLEKCLIEALQELIGQPAVVGIQDLGAAGLTSAVAEAASRGGSGALIDLDRVPRRELGMSPYEVMLSESQERMLVVVERGRQAEILPVFEKWDLHVAVIGEVTEDGHLTVEAEGRVAARIPVEVLTDKAPTRILQGRAPDAARRRLDLDAVPPVPESIAGSLLKLLGHPNIASKRSVFRRYDQQVGNATVIRPGGDAAMIRINGTSIGIAMTTDCNSRYCELDPYLGAQIAIAEAARNIVATGARPVAISDCLNFGNPDKPEVYWQLEETTSGMANACRALDLPIVSGNVSLYNDTDGRSIHPTPVIGMIGVIDDYHKRLEAGFAVDGDFVLMVGASGNDLGGSRYLEIEHDLFAGRPPEVDLLGERAAHEYLLAAAAGGHLRSAHDVSEGGMLVALAEACLIGERGVRCPPLATSADLRTDALYFGETQGRFVISAPSRSMPELQNLARRHRVEIQLLGLIGGDALEFEGEFSIPLVELAAAYYGAFEQGGVQT
ncbi:MAG TPA: phosphoribosylformylglycinamidine synthase subunit PurL [Candidatus Dormibacteraeota bacterium]